MVKPKTTQYREDLKIARELEVLEKAGIIPTPEEPGSLLEEQLTREYVLTTQAHLAAHLNSFSGYVMLPPVMQARVQELYMEEVCENLSERFDAPEFTALNMKLSYLSEFTEFLEKTAEFRPNYYGQLLQEYLESENGKELDDMAIAIAGRALEYAISELEAVPEKKVRAIKNAMARKVNAHHAMLKRRNRWIENREQIEWEDYACEQIESFQMNVLRQHKIGPYQMLKDRFGFEYLKFDYSITIGKNRLGAGIFREYEDRIEDKLMQIVGFSESTARLETLIAAHYKT